MNLAVLSRQFFIEQPPHSDLYQKWQASYAWNEQIVPIYEWESILYIGVTEHHDFQFDFPCVQILCEPQDLQNVWQSFQGDREMSTSEDKSGDPFANLESSLSMRKPQATSAPSDLLQDSSDDSPLQNKHDEEHSQMTVETTEDDAPTGLTMDVPTPTLSFVMPQASGPQAPAPSHEEKTQSIALPPEEKPAEAMPVKRTSPVSVAPPAPPLPVKEITVSTIARATDTFAQMHNYFQKAMILKVDGKTVKPWKWDDKFKPASQTSELTLETPSPFRIVNRTAKPYHGYIVANELNEKFFQEWNNNEIPDHITLAPVVVDDRVVAMLLGIGDKASDNKMSLQQAEKVAAKISVEMKQAAAKAA